LGDFSPNGLFLIFGTFYEKYRRSPKVWDLPSTVRVLCKLILAKKGFGNIFGDFLTNSSGHPGFQ
jgi:hypothetical protein